MAAGINRGIGNQALFAAKNASFSSRTIGRSQGRRLVVPKQDDWSFPRRTIDRSQGGQLVVPKQDNWSFPSRTIGCSQAGQLVVPTQDNWSFSSRTIDRSKQDNWWFGNLTRSQAGQLVVPKQENDAPKRPRRNVCRNVHAETSTPKSPRRNVRDAEFFGRNKFWWPYNPFSVHGILPGTSEKKSSIFVTAAAAGAWQSWV